MNSRINRRMTWDGVTSSISQSFSKTAFLSGSIRTVRRAVRCSCIGTALFTFNVHTMTIKCNDVNQVSRSPPLSCLGRQRRDRRSG